MTYLLFDIVKKTSLSSFHLQGRGFNDAHKTKVVNAFAARILSLLDPFMRVQVVC